jgi:hypothetical protein
MALFTQYSFPASDIRSLCWRGDELVDWVGGERVFALDGKEQRRKVNYAYRFDAATASPDGRFAVIYERLGTKGLVLHDGKVLRELNRSFYHAHAYEYPVALFHDPGGRLLLAYCSEYSRLELEEAESGRLLTVSSARKLSSYFHSRLTASPGGKRLASAGWYWHPQNFVLHFDVAKALVEPAHLDGLDWVSPDVSVEDDCACWLDDDRIVLSATDQPEQLEERNEVGAQPRLHPKGLAVHDLASARCIRAFELDEPAGMIFAVGPHHVLSLYRHPKLIDLTGGKVLHVWTDLRSGLQTGSIVWGLKDDALPPPMGFDPVSKRFAIADGNGVTVIAFDPSALDAFAIAPVAASGSPEH